MNSTFKLRALNEFIALPHKGRPPGGSSMDIQYFLEEITKQQWIGKCNGKALEFDYSEECKELLALKLYDSFGVKIPNICLSFQTIATTAQQELDGLFPDIDKPRLHIMSQYIEGFEILGDDFIKNYKKETTGRETFHEVMVGKKRIPLIGFGAALAVSNFLHDYDCIGNSGGNMGYIIDPSGNFAQVVKIDAGEALPFMTKLDENKQNDPEKRNIQIGTTISALSFEELSKADQNEFATTVELILKFPESKIKKLFKEIQFNNKFEGGLKNEVCETTLELLWARKTLFLNAFSPEVKRS